MKKINLFILCSICLASLSLLGQGLPLRHSSVGSDGWVSCSPSANPNAARGNSHWIMYNFGNPYTLTNLRLWNYNQPDSLTSGIQNLRIDISTNGTSWMDLGTFSLAQASGSSFYEGNIVTNLNGKVAKYLLITATSNYGGACYGLSEARFDLQQTALPVIITDFKLNCGNGSTNLSWEVKQEKDIIGYRIEGSKDASNWTSIKTVKSEGAKNYYTALNIDESDFTYYRLNIDENSTSDWNSILVYNDCHKTSGDITAWPNPVQESTNIKLENIANYTGQINIVDVKGSLVRSINLQKLTNQTLVNMGDLAPGQYFIILKNAVKDQVIPVSKM